MNKYYDKYNDFIIQNKRIKIKNLLLIAGGGTSATFYAMGAIKCLIDNNLFDFDVISAVSGGTILTNFIELAIYNKYHTKKNWYNIYIRDIFYKFIEEKLFAQLFLIKFNKQKMNNILDNYFNTIFKPFNKKLKYKKLNTQFFYHTVNFYKQNVEFDHNDIYNINNNHKISNWYLKRIISCISPLCFINNKVTMDAGICDINGFSILNNYDPENIVIISPISNIKKNIYKNYSPIKFMRRILRTVFESSYKTVDDLAKIILKDKNVIFCNMSNIATNSQDKYHKDLFQDYYNDITHFKTCSVGILFSNTLFLKVIENEGYIQMYYALLKNNKNIKFDIPNPDVYNENVRKIYNDFKKSNLFVEILKDISILTKK